MLKQEMKWTELDLDHALKPLNFPTTKICIVNIFPNIVDNFKETPQPNDNENIEEIMLFNEMSSEIFQLINEIRMDYSGFISKFDSSNKWLI